MFPSRDGGNRMGFPKAKLFKILDYLWPLCSSYRTLLMPLHAKQPLCVTENGTQKQQWRGSEIQITREGESLHYDISITIKYIIALLQLAANFRDSGNHFTQFMKVKHAPWIPQNWCILSCERSSVTEHVITLHISELGETDVPFPLLWLWDLFVWLWNPCNL